jgi:hypothetical protein
MITMSQPGIHLQGPSMENLGQPAAFLRNSNRITDSIQVLHQMNNVAQPIPNQHSNVISQVTQQIHPMNLMAQPIPIPNSQFINQSTSLYTTQNDYQLDLLEKNRNQAITSNIIANHLNQISHNQIIPDLGEHEHKTELITHYEQQHSPQNIHTQSDQQLTVNNVMSDDENVENLSPIFHNVITVPSFEIMEPEIQGNPPEKDQEKGKKNIFFKFSYE